MSSKRELEIENSELADENDSLKSSLADIKEQIEEIIGNDDSEDEEQESDES